MKHLNLTPYQEQTLKILITETSSDCPIIGSKMAKRISLKSQGSKKEDASMRAIIHALRIKGFPICANARGYFYAKTSEDVHKFVNRLQNRIISQEEALKGLKASYHNVGRVAGATEANVPITVPRAVRAPGATAVKIMHLQVGENGSPIVPEGLQLV